MEQSLQQILEGLLTGQDKTNAKLAEMEARAEPAADTGGPVDRPR
jgi:hypothetical protein